MSLTPRQRITWAAHAWKAVFKTYHRQLEPLLRAILDGDAVLFDVGAHSGQFAKLFSRIARTGHVYAFEPGGYAFSILQIVKRTHRLRNTTILRLGLGDADRTLSLHTPVKSSGSLAFGTASIVGHGTDGRGRIETIETTSIDLFVARRRLERVDLIKIDVEGFEPQVIAGATATLARFRPFLLLELNEVALAQAGATPAALTRTLRDLGYDFLQLANYDGKNRAPLVLARGFDRGDVLAFHESRRARVDDAVRTLRLVILDPDGSGALPGR